ncbi:glycosyltransferase [Lutimonas zeaxanthinifaciens]|uniref:glycosyltransferase n=1 Tax=Lutimonas zeaxanthinifaciens TaxID=3060215 RepID=UPI00265D595C|nr:glycosyltransferase [Lutimonas sp. YSD2104]WKK66195.1 glycosyltransferase [Lutimonas sp. YSD2104]
MKERSDLLYLRRRGISWKNVVKLKKTITNKEYEVVIARGIESVLLLSFIGKPNIKIIFFLTGLGRLFDESIPFKGIIRFCYRKVFKLLVFLKNADVVLQNEEDKKDLGLKNCHIMNGSGIKLEKTLDKSLSDKKVKILTASRLTKSKGIEEIFHFCEHVKNNPSMEYFILGDYIDLGLKEQRKIREFNKFDNIHFKGFESNTRVYFEECHVAYFPTNYREGSPRFLIESLKFGLVIFTNKMPGCSKTISNKNGYFFSSIENMIEIIEHLKYNENEFKSLSNRAKELFKQVYTEDVVYEGLINFIDRN